MTDSDFITRITYIVEDFKTFGDLESLEENVMKLKEEVEGMR